MPSTRKALFRWARILSTTGLLLYVFYSSGLFGTEGRQHFYQTVVDANLWLLAVSLFFPVALDALSALKWHLLALALKVPSTVGLLFSYYLMGRFFNLVLPSNIGGDLVRVHLHGKASGLPAQCAAAVFMERFSGLIVLVLIAVALMLYEARVLHIPFMDLAMAATLLIILFAALAMWSDSLFQRLSDVTRRVAPRFEGVLLKAAKLRINVQLYRARPATLLHALVLSLLFYALAIVYVWMVVLAFQPEVTLVSMVVAVPLIMVMMNLPISIGNIGLMEFAYTVILGLMGVQPDAALATALIMRLHTFLAAGLGSALYALRRDEAAAELLTRPPASEK